MYGNALSVFRDFPSCRRRPKDNVDTTANECIERGTKGRAGGAGGISGGGEEGRGEKESV